MLHEMKLTEGPFGRMEKGLKLLELRLYDDKRKSIRLGDEIVFKLLPDLEKQILTKVTGLLIYPKFESMIDDLPACLLGYKEEDKDYLRTSMYEIYSRDDEEKFGALGIRLEILK